MESSLTIETHIESLNNIERKKHLQKLKIIKHLYVKGAKTNTDLCARFGISSPTSMGLLNELMTEGLVEKRGRGKSVGGRKPDLYGMKDNSLFVLSIDMERYRTRMAIFDSNHNNITGTHTLPLEITKSMAAVDKLQDFANQLIEQSGINTEKLMGIGVSMPGLVSSSSGKNHTYLIPPGENETLQEVLETRFGKPVYIQNDVKSATLAEFRFGMAQHQKNTLVLSMDWGLGLGIIIDGKLRTGSSGFAGEFGHIPMTEDGLLCHCGKRGCLETLASGIALANMVREGIKAGQSTMLSSLTPAQLEQLEPKLIIAAANEGDQYAINILAEAGRHLGKGIAILIQLFNPELIILSGIIAEAKQYITIPIQQSVNTYCMTQLRESTSIAVSDLGKDAGILGSVATVMENIFEKQIATVK
ncbi:ROK family transcriptional regulator [Pontibacter sp. CAU 1760]